jgi:hypothetical protein
MGGCQATARISFQRERVYRAVTKQRTFLLAIVAQQRYYMLQYILRQCCKTKYGKGKVVSVLTELITTP